VSTEGRSFELAIVQQEVDTIPPEYEFIGRWSHKGGVEVDGPGWNDLHRAIRWGRARAPHVLIHVRESSSNDCWTWEERKHLAAEWKSYSPGEKAPTNASYAVYPKLRVIGEEPETTKDPGYGGVVRIFQLVPTYKSRAMYTARLQRHRGVAFDVVDALNGVTIEEAVRWSEDRAQNVIVGFGDPDTYDYHVVKTAGMPSLGDLPSW
jgi:hypothetical protein